MKTSNAKSKRRVSFNYDVHKSAYQLEDADDSDNDPQSSDTDSFNSDVSNDEDVQDNVEELGRGEEDDIIVLIKLLRGLQNYDSINTEMQKSRFEIEALLRKLGPHNNIHS